MLLAASSHILITQRVIKCVARVNNTIPCLKLGVCSCNAARACQIESEDDRAKGRRARSEPPAPPSHVHSTALPNGTAHHSTPTQ